MSSPRSVRIAALLAVAVLTLPPGVAPAQNSPFGSLPEGTPETPTQTTTTSSSSGGGLSTMEALLVVAAGIGVITGIAFAIARDARRRAPLTAGDSESAHLSADAHKRGRASKRKQRSKAKAARDQRRRNR